VFPQFIDELRREGERAIGAMRLGLLEPRRAVRSRQVQRLPHKEAAMVTVDVAPAQGEKLTESEAAEQSHSQR
jgi:hypothetical protein